MDSIGTLRERMAGGMSDCLGSALKSTCALNSNVWARFRQRFVCKLAAESSECLGWNDCLCAAESLLLPTN